MRGGAEASGLSELADEGQVARRCRENVLEVLARRVELLTFEVNATLPHLVARVEYGLSVEVELLLDREQAAERRRADLHALVVGADADADAAEQPLRTLHLSARARVRLLHVHLRVCRARAREVAAAEKHVADLCENELCVVRTLFGRERRGCRGGSTSRGPCRAGQRGLATAAARGPCGVEVVRGAVVRERCVVLPLPLVEFAEEVLRRGLAHAVARRLERLQRALKVDECFGCPAAVQKGATLLALLARAARLLSFRRDARRRARRARRHDANKNQ